MEASFHQSRGLSKEALSQLTRRRNGPALLRFLLHYGFFLGSAAALVVSHGAAWWLTALAMLAFGLSTTTLFAMLHESGHNTAFASRSMNRWVATLAAYAYFYIPTGFREFHFQHHRHTHDPLRDPEISVGGKPATGFTAAPLPYLLYLSGLPIWLGKVGMIVTAALGVWGPFWSYVPQAKRRRMVAEAWVFLALHAGIVVGAVLWMPGLALLYPGYALGSMILSIYLPAEHGGLPHEGSILARTRHIRTGALVRWALWNMPYHAEHHAYPAVPFHRLPDLSDAMRDELLEHDKTVPRFQSWMLGRLFRRR